MIDTHCHLTHPKLLPGVAAVIERSRAAGVTRAMTIGTGCDDARRGLELRGRYPDFVACAAGIDPFTSHDRGEAFGDELAQLRELLSAGGFQALGEVGLDYHYDLDPKAVQAQRFEAQLDLAGGLGLPVVIHVREAHDDMIAILVNHPQRRGVIHSFTGGPEVAGRYLELGWYLAFNGVLTFPAAEEVRAAARIVPRDRLLAETDAPYLAPVPLRGRTCEPGHVAHTLKRLAEVRGEAMEPLAAITAANAEALFGIRGD